MSITITNPGVGGISVETDPTALKLTGGTISGNLVVQPGTSNNVVPLTITLPTAATVDAIRINDSNPDSSPVIVDKDGCLVVGDTISQGYKIRVVNGTSRFEGLLQGYTIQALYGLTVAGEDVRNYVINHLFSGNVVKSTTASLTASVYYQDSNYNYFSSGNNDYNGNTIPYPVYGSTPQDISWNGSSFSVVSGTPSYEPYGTQIGSFTDSNYNSVYIYSDGNGGIYYYPPSN